MFDGSILTHKVLRPDTFESFIEYIFDNFEGKLAKLFHRIFRDQIQ